MELTAHSSGSSGKPSFTRSQTCQRRLAVSVDGSSSLRSKIPQKFFRLPIYKGSPIIFSRSSFDEYDAADPFTATASEAKTWNRQRGPSRHRKHSGPQYAMPQQNGVPWIDYSLEPRTHSNKTIELTIHSSGSQRSSSFPRSQTCQSHMPLTVDGSSSLRSKIPQKFFRMPICKGAPILSSRSSFVEFDAADPFTETENECKTDNRQRGSSRHRKHIEPQYAMPQQYGESWIDYSLEPRTHSNKTIELTIHSSGS